jgi:hypothetical protein
VPRPEGIRGPRDVVRDFRSKRPSPETRRADRAESSLDETDRQAWADIEDDLMRALFDDGSRGDRTEGICCDVEPMGLVALEATGS